MREGVCLFEGDTLIVSTKFSRGYVYLGATLIRNSRVDTNRPVLMKALFKILKKCRCYYSTDYEDPCGDFTWTSDGPGFTDDFYNIMFEKLVFEFLYVTGLSN